MRKIMWYLVGLLGLLSSSLAIAGSCSVNGNKDFTISFRVTALPVYQQFYLQQGSHGQVLWYTQTKRTGGSYIFNEPNLVTGTRYDIRITNDASTDTLHYYRKKATDTAWELIEVQTHTLSNGNLRPSTSTGFSNVNCGSNVINPPPIASNNAKYEFGVKQCSSMPCTIDFDQSYSYTPLVFVMPTIKTNSPDKDAPARLYITSTLSPSSTSVTINQHSRPELSSNFSTKQMTSISYLIMEPGVASVGGHEVVAGYLNSAKYYAKSGGNTGSDQAYFSQFGGTTYSSNPVVLHQIQTNNNGGRWMTSGRLWESNGTRRSERIKLFLELSASRNFSYTYQQEKIAFIATRPSSRLELDDYFVQFINNVKSVSQTGTDPMADGCDDRFFSTSLSRIDGVIMRKQERAGGHGGWLRRCDIKTNRVSAVVDEDFRDRTHIEERIGFMAFEAKPKVGSCEYFPTALQTNSYFNGLPFASDVSLSGSRNKLYLESRAPVSFNIMTAISTSGCVYGGGSTPESCLFNGTITYPNFPPALPTFQDGTAVVNCTNGCNQTITPGSYHSITVGSGSSAVTLQPGVYWVDTLVMDADDAQLKVNGQVILHYRDLSIDGHRVKFNSGGDFKELFLIGHGSRANISILKNDVEIVGNLYIDDSTQASQHLTVIGARMRFEGAMSLQRLLSTGNDNEFVARVPDSCSPPTDDYQLTVSPTTDIGLMCGTDLPTFTINTTNLSSPISTGVTVEMYRNSVGDASYLQASVAGGIGSGSGNSFTTDANGQLKLAISSTNPSATILDTPYNLRVEMTADSAQTAVRTYKFLPFKFSVADAVSIAGKETSITAKVLACDVNNSPIIAQSYTGTPAVSHQVITPTVAEGGIDGTLVYSPQFSSSEQGQTIDDLVIDESGQFSVTLTDNRFDCTGLSGCPIDGNAQLTGSFTLEVRPWKIALCDIHEAGNSSNLNPATTTESQGFMRSGGNFNVTYRPIVYSNSPSDECALAITDNYAKDGGPLNVQYALSYPTGGDLGMVTPVSVSAFDGTSSTKEVTHTWDEVGSLNFTTSAIYLGMNLDEDAQVIGRFYPAHFEMKTLAEQWQYATGHNGFAYMSQPISHEFTVEAQNSDDVPTSNYGLFSDGLIADLKYLAKQTSGTSLFNRVMATSNWNSGEWGTKNDWNLAKNGSVNTAQLELSFNDFRFEKQTVTHSSGRYTTEPDGPFDSSNAEFGLEIENAVDGVQFKVVSGAVTSLVNQVGFSTQPDFRYGRMHLFDGGTITGQNALTIPLRLEFWDQTRFVTNTDDSASTFDADDYCTQVIWRTDSQTQSDVTMSGQGAVTSGVSSDLQIDHNNSTNELREQVRAWVRVNPTPPIALSGEQAVQCSSDGAINDQSWLRFNWRNNGDEDPSAVVTFGIYRGNDRVIFRGEPGLIGQ